MAKFGEIIKREGIVLLIMESERVKYDPNSLNPWLNTWGVSVSAVKLEDEKNEELFQALRIKAVPTYLVYKNGEQIHRSSDQNNIQPTIKFIDNLLKTTK